MKIRHILLSVLSVCAFSPGNAAIPDGYYNSCEGLTGEPLLQALFSQISEHTALTYNGLWTLYRTSDADENGNLIDIYSTKRWTPGTEQCGTGQSCVGSCYTREHSFPKSWFGGTVMPMYTDAFHIYPADFYVNNQRNNNPYGECENGVTKPDCNGYQALGKLGTSTFPGYTGKVFEPVDEYKGDLARGYFYMAACYYDQINTWSTVMLGGTKYPAFSDWALELLLKWHRQDPVSDKELARQEVVYGAQKNRNPFIDHPELVEYIWGNRNGYPWSVTLSDDPVINQPVSGSTIDFGTVKTGDKLTIEIPIVGSCLTDDIVIAIDNRPTSADESTVVVPDVPDTPVDFYSFVWTTPTELTPSQTMTSTILNVNGVEFTNGPVTVKSVTGTGSTTPRLFDQSGNVALRFYEGNTTTFSSKAGHINAIDLGTTAAAMYGVATVSSGELSKDGLHWTGDATSVTFTWKKYTKTATSTTFNNPIMTYFTVYTDVEHERSVDILNASLFGIPAATAKYADFSATGSTGRTFAANAYGKQPFLQLRSSDKSGIISTAEGEGSMLSVKIKWTADKNTEGRALSVYGSNTPYTSVADLYDASKQGTLIATFTYVEEDGLEAEHTFYDKPYKYIGVRSKSGAIYIDEIDITWDEDAPFVGYRSLSEWAASKPETAQPVLSPAMVIYQNGDWLYMSDGRTNMLVHGNLGHTYNPGDIIPEGYAGSYSIFNECPALVPDASTFKASTQVAETLPIAKYVELIELSAADANCYVSIDEVSLTGSSKVFTATAADGSTIRVYDQFNLGLSAVDDAELEGFINIYYGNLQLVPVKFTPNPHREFTNVGRVVSAEDANASTFISVDFIPEEEGTFYATLQIRSGSVASVVYLTGTGVNSLTALPATNISTDGFTANWVDMNNGEATYSLHVCRNGVEIEGFPKSVYCGLQQYEVDNLDDNTEYTYYLTYGTAKTQTIKVKTAKAQPEIEVMIDGEMGNIEGIVHDENLLRFFTAPGKPSPHATILIYASRIEGDLEISIDEPFQLSADLTNWSNLLTVDAAVDHVYMRLNGGEDEGIFYADLTVKGGFVAAQEAPQRSVTRDAGSWQVINDDISVYGRVSNDVTSVVDVISASEWEAYCLDGRLVIDNFADHAVTLGIYTLEGYAIATVEARPGKTVVNLPAGFYLVATSAEARSVVVK